MLFILSENTAKPVPAKIEDTKAARNTARSMCLSWLNIGSLKNKSAIKPFAAIRSENASKANENMTYLFL